jgi:hypothetical protein
MKLKGRAFPFWAWSRKKRDRYDIIRFIEKKGPWDEYVYDYNIRVHEYYSLPPHAYGGAMKYRGKYAKSTVQGFKDISTLPHGGKRILIAHIFKPTY